LCNELTEPFKKKKPKLCNVGDNVIPAFPFYSKRFEEKLIVTISLNH